MPHASIRILAGKTAEQKIKLAEDIGAAVVAGLTGKPAAPGRGVEYELVDIPPGNFARGGKLRAVSPPSAYVIIDILKPRTPEQKRRVAEYVTTAVAKTLKIPSDSDSIVVEITETPTKNIAHAGKTTFDNPPPVVI